jgi:hypothetical protein
MIVQDAELLTRREAAALMRVSPGTLANMHARGAGPAYLKTARVRGKALYRRAVVLAYLESNGRTPAAPAKAKRRKAAKA